ncbi:MAG: fatty-acid--CoA ligase, partial [Acidimicrobiales bacterium]
CWYAIAGKGSNCHTLNPRLFPDQLDYIVNHAENRFLVVDTTFLPVIANVIDRLKTVEGIIVLTSKDNMPDTSGFKIPVHCYEEMIKDEPSTYDWPTLDENAASSLCYTSGTTGNPKGVLYSHRSNMIHAMVSGGADIFNMTACDSFLMIVPMFHANSWGLSFGVPMIGGKLVMTGPHMDGASVYKLMTEEKCTVSGAVPTVWTGLLDYLDANDLKIPHLRETFIGGSAVPRSMIERFDKDYGVQVIQAWGMTEMSPLGTINRPLPFWDELSYEERMAVRCKQGRPAFYVDMKIVDDDGNELPRDGVAFGRLLVKGPFIVERYYKMEESALDDDGWFDTGDVANIDQYGIMQITDRAKDVIKSGGEWISSVDIENTAVGHPELNIAACIGVKHEKWEERPLLVAVKQEGCDPSKQSILDLVASEHAKWQVPDDVIFIEEMPLTATGKIDKKPLRAKYENFYS